METNIAFGVHSNVAIVEDEAYELMEVVPEPKKGSSSFSPAEVDSKKKEVVAKTEKIQKERETELEKKDYCFSIFITIIAVTALLLVLIFLSFFLVHYISYRSLETQQSASIETMQLLLNTSNEQLQFQASKFKEARNFIQSLQLQLNTSHEQLQLQASEIEEAQHFIQSLQLQLNKTVELRESLQTDFQLFIEEHQTDELLTHNRIQGIEQKLNNMFVHSCKDLPQGSLSGYYHIVTSSSGVIHAYCDTSVRNCSCIASVGWMRVANLDMTDPTQQCPDEFKLINRTEPPLRTCGRPNGTYGCVSTTFRAHGIEYSRVCGRIVGYQIGSPSGFRYQSVGIDSNYVSGISLTRGQPRQHIYSFANAQGEGYTSEVCPCIQGGTDTVPQFVGSDYFCDSTVRGSNATDGVFYSYDPLWDGQGCGSTSTCCEFNNPPWFCKQLSQPTTDDIEMRLCENDIPSIDESPFEVVELYIN